MPSILKPYADCQVGDTFFFGSYLQGRNGEMAPIEWRVLARKRRVLTRKRGRVVARKRARLLVISEYALDAKAYNEEFKDITWSQCTLRAWLNGEFLNKAFRPEERESLLEVTLRNPDIPEENYYLSGGPDTRDRVFVLSRDELERYFCADAERCCKATAYAVEKGAWTSEIDEFADNCWWWLRTPSIDNCIVECIFSNGSFSSSEVGIGWGAVRPALYLAL